MTDVPSAAKRVIPTCVGYEYFSIAAGINRMILVTGSTGFLGRHLMPMLLARYGSHGVVGTSSKDYDLMDHSDVKRMFRDIKPEVVVHLAAYSGGIGVNNARPADFYFRNTLLTALVFQEAAESGVKRLIYTMGGCSYPATARSPINEEQMWEGFPQKESAGYSCAKKMGIVASMAYRKQYGLDSVVLVPGNMYGEYDNYRNAESHVVPGMIRRFHEAKLSGAEEVVMWGTGAPTRDFVYAGDVAGVVAEFVEARDGAGPINISTGTSTSIRELSELVKSQVDFQGRLSWDTSKPDGQMVKIFDVARLRQLGLGCQTSLRDGLRRTADWFVKNYENKSDGIRL
jgi:GDP-L-fucose synthase